MRCRDRRPQGTTTRARATSTFCFMAAMPFVVALSSCDGHSAQHEIASMCESACEAQRTQCNTYCSYVSCPDTCGAMRTACVQRECPEFLAGTAAAATCFNACTELETGCHESCPQALGCTDGCAEAAHECINDTCLEFWTGSGARATCCAGCIEAAASCAANCRTCGMECDDAYDSCTVSCPAL
jgi:hypothetical protein